MSTRANIIIDDGNSKLIFYRHSDGYPEHCGEDLKKWVAGYGDGTMRTDAIQSAGWLIVRGHKEYEGDQPSYMEWKVGAYEPTASLHADVDFIYMINLDSGTLETRRVLPGYWDDPCLEKTKLICTYAWPVVARREA